MAEVPTPSQQEYEYLISHFDRLVKTTSIVLGLIIAVGLGMFYRSLAEVKADAKASVDATRISAQSDIAKAKDEVLASVREEARKRVDEEFNSRDITDLVEAAAKRKVGHTIDRQIQEEVGQAVSRLQDQMVETIEIANLGMEIRIIGTGSRAAFDELTTRYKRSDDPGIRRTEKIILDSVTADFEKVWKADLTRDQRTAQQQLSMDIRRPPNQAVPASTASFVNLIRTETDLNGVCLAFLALRDSTGVHFPMFDFDAVEKWCKENGPKCQQ
jgi:hypothetical protein